MKLFILVLLSISINAFSQGKQWKTVKMNDILTFAVPSHYESQHSQGIKAYGGQAGENYYGLQYYDSNKTVVQTDGQYKASLVGFISGRSSDPSLKGYGAVVVDTTMAGVSGIMVTYSTNNTSRFYRKIYYFVTIANGHYYWFYAQSHNLAVNDELKYFFRSIRFDIGKVKEKDFKLGEIFFQKTSL